ncbi:flagellar hook-basal body complex protein FliE [Indiicoccus explosivorum]|uniref:flagellar hook-basal body complex protein FliE n=1 Tax=Indiicoccus explosivorum TaxID=1917864 RepID=UPI000B4472D3|nr:flagellar hook-basal body complex protein FliE [Indiicoccus explosivorum]
MAIESVSMMKPEMLMPSGQTERKSPFETQQAFGEMLKNAIGEVNNAQQASDVMTRKLVQGEQVELHDVMITAQKASVMLNTSMEIRNKAIEAYQEILRMPV